MGLRDCVISARQQGAIDREEERALIALIEAHERRGASPADVQTAVAATLDAEALHRRRQALLTIQVTRQIRAELESHRNARGEVDPAAYLIHKLESFDAGLSTVEGRRLAILGQAHARMEALLHEFRRTPVLGRTRAKARLDNVVREAFGEGTGDQAAAALAHTWGDVSEAMRQRFNRAGGAIPVLKGWGLPQMHDRRAVGKVGRDAWKAAILPRLAPDRMRHPLTGDPMTGEEVAQALDHVWESIVTESWNTRSPARTPVGRGALANQRLDHRFLVFKSPADWLAYARDFGDGNAFAAMMHHVNLMARDIAALEQLGPNPQATLLWLQQVVEHEAANATAGRPALFPARNALGREWGAEGRMNYAGRAVRRSADMWAHMRGSVNAPVDSLLANTIDAATNIVTASALGAASLSSLGDIATQIAARRFAGLPSTRLLGEIVAQFRTADAREAVAASLIMDSALNVMHRQARYVGTLAGPQWSRWLADRVLTWSALTPWTQAERHAFGLAFQREAAERAGSVWDALPEPWRETVGRHGLTSADWRLLQLADHYTRKGVRFLRPSEVAAIGDGPRWQEAAALFGTEGDQEATRHAAERLADRYLEAILAETEFAVPSGSVRARSLLLGDQQAGTWHGSVARSFAQFKSFSVVMLLLHGGRVARDIAGGRPARGAAYAGALLITSTLFGALSMQLKDISKGRDPRDMTTPDFWGAALLQSGGLGIYGDFLFGDLNRFGHGFATTLAGPLIERVSNAWNLTGGNLVQVAGGENTNFGRELTTFLRQNTPGGSIWYARLAYERMVLDQLQYLLDPEAYKSFRSRERMFEREFDQGFWWRPGERTPQRAPELGNIAP